MKSFMLNYLNISESDILGGRRFNLHSIVVCNIVWELLKEKGFKEKTGFLILPDNLIAVSWNTFSTHIVEKNDLERIKLEKNSDSLIRIRWSSAADEFEIKIKEYGTWAGQKKLKDST